MPLWRVGSTPATSRAGFHTFRLKCDRWIGLCSRVWKTSLSSPVGKRWRWLRALRAERCERLRVASKLDPTTSSQRAVRGLG